MIENRTCPPLRRDLWFWIPFSVASVLLALVAQAAILSAIWRPGETVAAIGLDIESSLGVLIAVTAVLTLQVAIAALIALCVARLHRRASRQRFRSSNLHTM